jgi:hypothetical protein
LLCLARPGELFAVLVVVGLADGAGVPDAGGVDAGEVDAGRLDAGADGAGRVAAVSRTTLPTGTWPVG